MNEQAQDRFHPPQTDKEVVVYRYARALARPRARQ